jgi:hypothetical protein
VARIPAEQGDEPSRGVTARHPLTIASVPLTELACPPSAPSYGESHATEHCLTQCQHRCLSPFLLAGLMASNSRNHHRGKLISVTSLGTGGCARSLKLERTESYSDHPSGMLYAYRGTVAHAVVEDAASYTFPHGESLDEMGFLSEQRMLVAFCFEHGGFPVPEGADPYDNATWADVHCPNCREAGKPQEEVEWFFLSGTLDGFEPLWDRFDPTTGELPGVIHDLKTAAAYAVNSVIDGSGAEKSPYGHAVKPNYVEQLNCYKYLLESVAVPQQVVDAGRKRGLEVKRINVVRLQIQMFAMTEFPLTGVAYWWRKHWKDQHKAWEIPDLPVFDRDWAEQHIKRNGYAVFETLIKGIEPGAIPAPEKNSSGAHHWKCGTREKAGYCAFAFSHLCPDPASEWIFLQQGCSPQEAFDKVQNGETPMTLLKPTEPEPAKKPRKKKAAPQG